MQLTAGIFTCLHFHYICALSFIQVLKTGLFFKMKLKILRMNNRPSLLLADDNFSISSGNETDEVE